MTPYPTTPALIVAVAGLLWNTTQVQACCGFQIKSGDNYIHAYNMQGVGDTLGLVCINKRGVKKRSLSDEYLSGKERAGAQPVLTWTSKHGSITFCVESTDFPSAGLNEKGLFICEQALRGSVWKPEPGKPKAYLAQWMQYVLDNYQSVDELMTIFDRVPLTYVWTVEPFGGDHIMVMDASGNTGLIEYVDGRPALKFGATMPDPIANNCYYADRASNGPFNSVKAELAKAGDAAPVDLAFHICDMLGNISWNIIADSKNQVVYFRTSRNMDIRSISIAGWDFSPSSKMRCLDIDYLQKGNLTGKLAEWTPELNAAFVAKVYPAKTPNDSSWREKLDAYCRQYLGAQ